MPTRHTDREIPVASPGLPGDARKQPFEVTILPNDLPSRGGLIVGLTLLALSVAGWFYFSRHEQGNEDFRSLPAVERRALYERTFENLKHSCSSPAGEPLSEQCRAQAAFILEFPECTVSCRELAARLATRPTR